MEVLREIFNNSSFDGSMVEYYPHINVFYEGGGEIINETPKFTSPITLVKTNNYTEYVYNEKYLRVFQNKEKEFLQYQQQYSSIISDMNSSKGLMIISHWEYIDPNRFPIVNKYHDVRHKCISEYEYKNIIIDSILEDNDMNYIRISFPIHTSINDLVKKKLFANFKEVISLVS